MVSASQRRAAGPRGSQRLRAGTVSPSPGVQPRLQGADTAQGGPTKRWQPTRRSGEGGQLESLDLSDIPQLGHRCTIGPERWLLCRAGSWGCEVKSVRSC